MFRDNIHNVQLFSLDEIGSRSFIFLLVLIEDNISFHVSIPIFIYTFCLDMMRVTILNLRTFVNERFKLLFLENLNKIFNLRRWIDMHDSRRRPSIT